MTGRGSNGQGKGSDDSGFESPQHIDLRGVPVAANVSRSRRHVLCSTLLGPYLLGAVDADDAAEVEKHLSECASCEALFGQLADGLAALLPDVSPECLERIWSRVVIAIR